MSNDYYVAVDSSKKECYHADPECHDLRNSKVREAPESLTDRLRPCKRCIKNTVDREGRGSEWASISHQLRNADDPEQL